MKYKLTLNFDMRSLAALEQIASDGRHDDMGGAIREALQILRALQRQSSEGFSQIIVRNQATNEDRRLIVPTLEGLNDAH